MTPASPIVGEGGADNFINMVHNGIECGDLELIVEAYNIVKVVSGLSNAELADAFIEWNHGELESFFIEITADIFGVHDEHEDGEVVDKILDKIGIKGM